MDSVTQFFCPRCQQVALRSLNTGDFQHDCFGTEALANEDILIQGPWVDYTGSDPSITNVFMKGTENLLFGTRSAMEGAKFYPVTSRGFPKNLYRTRRHIEQINEETFEKREMISDSLPDEYAGEANKP